MRYSETSLAGVPSTFWAGGVHDTSRTPLPTPIVAQPTSTAIGTSGVTHRSRTRRFIATILPESELGAEGGSRSERFSQLALLSLFSNVGSKLRGSIECSRVRSFINGIEGKRPC
jgi:hypothetical protein